MAWPERKIPKMITLPPDGRLQTIFLLLSIGILPFCWNLDVSTVGRQTRLTARTSRLFTASSAIPSSSSQDDRPRKPAFDAAVLNRYACKRFKRFDDRDTSKMAKLAPSASPADPMVVQQALHCLELARYAPSGFNTQPGKVILVQSPAQKEALSKHCLGPNAARVLDSDCTAGAFK